MNSQPKILVVDDEPFNREIIAEFLASYDYDLVMAENGHEALEKLELDPESFDAVLLDRMMPGIDGIEVLKQIKQDARMKMLPVIMQTASSHPDQIAEGLSYGAFYYLTKPFGQAVLQAITTTAIRDRIERRRSLDEQAAKNASLHYLNHAEYVLRTPDEARAIAGFLAQLCPDPSTTYMGLVELLLNAVEHGNLAISYDEKTHLLNDNALQDEILRRLQLPQFAKRHATVCFKRQTTALEFTIVDEGEGFAWENFLEMRVERMADNHGRGIAMSKSIAFSELTYLGNGNTVVAKVTTIE